MTNPAISVAEYKHMVIDQIKEQREDRLLYDVRAEYPPGSGKMFSCSMSSQSTS